LQSNRLEIIVRRLMQSDQISDEAANVQPPRGKLASYRFANLHIDSLAATIEVHIAFDQSKNRVIVTHANISAWQKLRANLSNQNVSRANSFATKLLYAQSLRVAVATVTSGTLTFFVCHD
jgi:hypothetical protein